MNGATSFLGRLKFSNGVTYLVIHPISDLYLGSVIGFYRMRMSSKNSSLWPSCLQLEIFKQISQLNI